MSATLASASSLEQFALYGRAWNITVSLPGNNGTELITLSSDEFEPEALRVTFDVYTPAFQAFWYADIDIYNLDQSLTQRILNAAAPANSPSSSNAPITQGVIVQVQAGYQNGNYGTIWNGVVFQPLWERVNAIDYKLTLHCVIGLDELSRNFISGAYAAGMNQTQLLNRILAQTASGPYPLSPGSGSSISPNLPAKTLFRGMTLFGNPKKYLNQVAEDNNMQWWMSNKGLNLGSPAEDVEVNTAAPIVFSPPSLPGLNSSAPVIPTKSQGIIVGTPQQTQLGVSFRALLNANVKVEKPLMKVKLDYSQLRLQKKQLGQYPGILDQDGVYIVGGARFVGDTRGEDWYVDVTGYTVVGNSLALLQGFSAFQSGPNPNKP